MIDDVLLEHCGLLHVLPLFAHLGDLPDTFTGSGVSHRVYQWIYVVLICTKSDQLKTKSNPGKFLRKCSFSDL